MTPTLARILLEACDLVALALELLERRLRLLARRLELRLGLLEPPPCPLGVVLGPLRLGAGGAQLLAPAAGLGRLLLFLSLCLFLWLCARRRHCHPAAPAPASLPR